MGLFADIQHQVSKERQQARLQAQQAEAPRPTPIPTPQQRDSTAATRPAPFPTPLREQERPAPVLPQIGPINSGDTAAAIQRIKTDTERITRRTMKDAVAEYLAQSCSTNPDLALSVMAEQKTMVKCFGYINRKAREYAEQERKDNNITENGIYGCDVPDDLVYQWAVTYFMDPNADKEPERKVPPKSAAKAKSKVETKQQTPPSDGGEQMTLMEAV